MPSTPRSLPKHIAATLAKPVMGAVVALLFFTVLSPATLVARVIEPDDLSQIRLPTPTPARAQSSAGASIQPTPIPTLADPIGTVLVERLRLRAGPGEGFPILERTFPGDQLALLGQTSGCEWLFVTSPSGQSGWVSGDPSLVRINVGCALLHVVETIVPTPTLSPTPADTIAPTPTRTRTPTPTATPLTAPVVTLRPAISPWTPTPTPRPTLRPTATSNAPATTAATTAATAAALAIQPTRDPLVGFALVGPRSVGALLPESGTETFQRIPFSWEADQPLAPGQLFEVAFWRKGQPMEEAHGWTAATTNNTLSANTYEQTPGEYLWGVWLGAMVDGQYHRLRYLGGGNLLHVLSEAPQESAPSAPAPTDCPPTAPCK